MRVIRYGSHTLTPAEQLPFSLEFLALKWAECDKYKDHLFYTPHLIVYTDNNNPLTYTMNTANLNVIVHHRVEQLAEFHFEIRHKPGKLNTDAHTLSWCPLNINT